MWYGNLKIHNAITLGGILSDKDKTFFLYNNWK